jgi:hypothetical protein
VESNDGRASAETGATAIDSGSIYGWHTSVANHKLHCSAQSFEHAEINKNVQHLMLAFLPGFSEAKNDT